MTDYFLLEIPDELWINEILRHLDNRSLYENFKLVNKKALDMTFPAITYIYCGYEQTYDINKNLYPKMINFKHLDAGYCLYNFNYSDSTSEYEKTKIISLLPNIKSFSCLMGEGGWLHYKHFSKWTNTLKYITHLECDDEVYYKDINTFKYLKCLSIIVSIDDDKKILLQDLNIPSLESIEIILFNNKLDLSNCYGIKNIKRLTIVNNYSNWSEEEDAILIGINIFRQLEYMRIVCLDGDRIIFNNNKLENITHLKTCILEGNIDISTEKYILQNNCNLKNIKIEHLNISDIILLPVFKYLKTVDITSINVSDDLLKEIKLYTKLFQYIQLVEYLKLNYKQLILLSRCNIKMNFNRLDVYEYNYKLQIDDFSFILEYLSNYTHLRLLGLQQSNRYINSLDIKYKLILEKIKMSIPNIDIIKINNIYNWIDSFDSFDNY